MAAADPPIIITNGSVSVDFGSSHIKFQHDGKGKHQNDQQDIKRIEVTGDGISINEAISDGKLVIKVYYG